MPEIAKISDARLSELRQAFSEYDATIAYNNARRAAVFAAAFMLAGWSLDLVTKTEWAQEFLVIRGACAALLGIIFWYIGRAKVSKASRIVAQGIAMLPVFSICTMIGLTTGGNSIYYAGLSLVLVGLSLLLRWTFMNSLAVIIATFFCYALSVMISPVSPDWATLFSNSYFLAVTGIFVAAGSYYTEALRFREFCLRVEVEESKSLLEYQNRKLSELDEAKTRFFANISHELRTPLTVMLGISERLKSLLQKPGLDPNLQEMTLMLEQNGLRLLKLIDDLLDLVRFDTGHADIKKQPTFIKEHLDGLLLSLRHLAEQDRVSLAWQCDTLHPSLQIDRDKFDKILLNLVINAIKFTPSTGTIDVTIKANHNQIEMAVEDSGVGIPPEVLPRIFERFWQVDSSSTRKFQGAGIGLALVRSLTEAMGGTVTVTSQLGHGTKFTVKLPTEAADEMAENAILFDDRLKGGGHIAELHRRAALSGATKMDRHQTHASVAGTSISPPQIGGRPSGARPLVLIADDEPDIRRFLRMQLENVDVIEAADGSEALELAKLRRPQLALLDHMMPEMDGVEVCRHIRQNHTTRGVAVIILTARADEQTKLAALEAGANDFLTKPFSSAELSLRLENQIAMARIRREMNDINTELNAALEQIKENEVMMVRNEKLSALGRMSAGIIHEINNPLNYASAGIHALETFKRSLPEKEIADYEDILRDVREGVERVSQIVIDLRKFTRDEKSISGDADLTEIVGRSRRMISHQLGKDIEFTLRMPDNALISGNPNQLVQVFINFFQNSIDAIHMRLAEAGGESGEISCVIADDGNAWQVSVHDNGIGIPPDNVEKIFDPFFTSKDVGKGMGLGLSITHQILQSHKARIEVESSPGKYTCFHIAFPKVSYDPDSPETMLDQPA